MTKARPRKNPTPRTATKTSQEIETAKGFPATSTPSKQWLHMIAYGTFKNMACILIEENKILISGGHVVWVFTGNPKLAFPLVNGAPTRILATSNTEWGRICA